jgi:hypothetical protein
MRSTRRALKITLLLAVTSLLLIHGGGRLRADGPALSWDGLVENVTAPLYFFDIAPNGSSRLPRHSISADGRYVLFTSDATNLVSSVIPPAVYLRDRETGETQQILPGEMSDLALSGDGNYVAFRNCNPYFRPDNTPICDVWVLDRRNFSLQPMSVALDGTYGDADSSAPVLSATGRFVVFRTNATNLLPPGAAPGQLVVRDRDADGNGIFDEPGTETIELVSAADGSNAPGNAGSDSPEISDDGRYVAFRSMANNLVVYDSNSHGEVFERDRVTHETRLLNRRPTGQASPIPIDRPEISMSADGRFVTFASRDPFLAGQDDNEFYDDVFVYDHDTQFLTRIVLSDPIADLFDVNSPMLTADGRYVVMRALSNNNAVPWGGQARSTFVFDRVTGTSTKIGVLANGVDLNDNADSQAISADGTVVLFTSKASNVANGLDYQFDKIFAAVHLDVSPSEVTVPGQGGRGTFTVTTQAHTRWSVNVDFTQNWFWLETPPFQNVGNGPVTLNAYVANPDPTPRSVSVTIGSRVVTFTQNAGLSLTSISPSVGPSAGGTVVTLRGTGFEPGMVMQTQFGGVPVEFVDSTTVRATTPPGQPGLTYIGLTTTDYRFAAIFDAFRYLDGTPPEVWVFPQGQQGDNDWYTSDVVINWVWRDSESQITSTSGCGNVTVTEDTPGRTFTCSVTSEGGTTTRSITIKRDTTPPVIVITQPAQTIYTFGSVVPAIYSCTDALSGTASCSGDVALGEPIFTGSTTREQPFYAYGRDQAGNWGFASVVYAISLPMCYPLDTAPRAWWRMEGDTHDISGGLSAVANNFDGGTFAPAIVGQGFSFPSRTAGFLQVAPSSRLDFDNVMSIMLWIKPTAASQGVILSHPAQYSLQRLADGSIQWTFQQNDGGSISATIPNALPQDVWTHLAVTYEGGLVNTYVNGQLVHSDSRPAALQTPNASSGLTIGGQDQQGAPLPFVGSIDELQLFDRALEPWLVDYIYFSAGFGLCVPAPTTLAVNMPTAIDFGVASYHVSAVLMDGNGQALEGKSLTLSSGFGAGASTVMLVTDASGAVSWDAPANFASAGTYTNAFTAAFEGDAQYQRSSISHDLVVQKLTPHITWSAPGNITYGTPLSATQLNASADVPGTFSYNPPAGTVFGAGIQSLSVLFTPSDSADYNNATTSVTLTVDRALPSMSITGGTFTYDGQPHNATVSAVDYLGQPLSPVTITYNGTTNPPVNAGTYAAVASYPGNSNYLPQSVSATITINRATPSITWAAPAPIVYGTALTGAQLNATANVPGTFSYTPAAGTRLSAGSGITLSTNFAPTDTTNYTNATTTRTIDVLRAPLSVTTLNASTVYGAPVLGFLASGSGFVNGDSMASLSGTLTFSTPATASSPVGSYPVTPSGLSSPNYTITFIAGTLTIIRASSVVVVNSSANPSGSNQAVTFTATAGVVAPGAGTPTGTIEFRDGSTRLGTITLINGSASLTTNGFSATSHTINAVYSGDSNITGSAQSLTQTVLTSTQSSTTALASSSNPATSGASVTLTATVTAPSGLSGNVAFYDGATLIGTAALSGTKAKLIISTLSNGTHAITARYLGNPTIPPSISPAFAQTIKPSGTTLRNSSATVVVAPSPSALDQSVTFTATVSGNQSTPPTGVVVFFVDGFLASEPVALSPNGNASARATFSTSALAHGVHDITVAYLGDSTYKGDTGTTSLTVN